MTAVNTLPVEVVTHIMRYLDVSDRKSAALVNRKWYEASTDPILLKNIVFTFRASASFDDSLQALLRKRVAKVVFESMDSCLARSLTAAACPDIFSGIRSLSLSGCDLTEAIFVRILSYCTDLESLDISGCNTLFMTGMLLFKSEEVAVLRASLCNVRELKLASIRYISDATFNRLVSVCPKMERLTLAGNQIIFHSDNYYSVGGAADGSGTGGSRPNTAVLTFRNIMKFLTAEAARITMLNFGRTSINDDSLASIVKIPGLCLHELRLSCCRDVSDDGIDILARNQPSLRILDVSECLEITDKGLDAICKFLVGLVDLDISKCRQVTDNSVCKLRSLVNLSALDMNACYTVSSKGLALGLCHGTLNSLTSLKLNCCSSVRDVLVVEACERLPLLTVLDISSCSITNASVFAISKFLTRLVSLRLAWCQEITDNGLLGIRDAEVHKHDDDDVGMCRCTRKNHKTMMFRPKLPPADDVPKSVRERDIEFEDVYPITNLKNLRLLDLSSCHRLTDTSITKVMIFRDLKILHLSLCPALTDKTIATIATAIPNLEELHIAQCNKITDHGIVYLTERAKRLSLLNISSCDRLTNHSVEALFVNTKCLKTLDVSLCANISMEAVDMLENGLSNLSIQRRLVGAKAY